MRHVMLDLETLACNRDAVIVSIGARRFDPLGEFVIPPNEVEFKEVDGSYVDFEHFYHRIDYSHCLKMGMKVDADTLRWWLSQKEDLRYEAIQAMPRTPLGSVLKEFEIWCRDIEGIWSNGSSFDIEIMRYYYEKSGKSQPWKFKDIRDCRTLLASVKEQSSIIWPVETEKFKHHPLYDAYRQAHVVQQCYRLNHGVNPQLPTLGCGI